MHARQTSERRKVGRRGSNPGVFVGMLNSSSEAVVVTEHGLAIKTRLANIRRVPMSERWDADSILRVRATPWSPDGSDTAFDIQVGMERPAEMVPRDPGEVLMRKQGYRGPTFAGADFRARWGVSGFTAKHAGVRIEAC